MVPPSCQLPSFKGFQEGMLWRLQHGGLCESVRSPRLPPLWSVCSESPSSWEGSASWTWAEPFLWEIVVACLKILYLNQHNSQLLVKNSFFIIKRLKKPQSFKKYIK
jgi:hypothetical protein